ncbi:MAG: TIGR03936 family radical SAM-associated protein [Elusimicrobiota bacterium]|nr:TIGR03936 family radical SAM-associated protein [Elusimicrobiota bacterium]
MESKRVRIKYSKKYPASLIGHLDTVREVLRGMRRAAWQFEFTAGFNPAVKYSSTPALSLGFLSEAEYIDLWLKENLKDFKKDIFKTSLADGLEVNRINALSPDAETINEEVRGFRYEVASKDGSQVQFVKKKKAVKLVKRGEDYIIVDTFKRGGGIGNPRKNIGEGNYRIKKLSCIRGDGTHF